MNRRFYIAGVKFHEMHKVINDLEVGQTLTLEPEPDNPYDSNAVKILSNDVMLGYVPKKFSAEVSMMIEEGFALSCVVNFINPVAKPWEQCEVEISDEKFEEAGPDIGDGPDYDSDAFTP